MAGAPLPFWGGTLFNGLLFEATDRTGYTIDVQTADLSPDRRETVFIRTSDLGVYLVPAEVDGLRAALAPYGIPPLARPEIARLLNLVETYGDARAERVAALPDVERWRRAAARVDRARGEISAALAAALIGCAGCAA